MDAYIDKKSEVSDFQPSTEVIAFTKQVKEDYSLGVDILNRTWVELNNRSVIEDENRGQMMFNAFVDTTVEDAGEAWKWRGTRSMARNKGIAMHANLTANYILPLFTAQNENDEVDRGFSEVMRDIVEWMASPTNSNYQSSFLQIVNGALTNPVTYLGAEFCEVYQTIKEKQEDGSYTKKEVLDEVLSGFKCPIWSSSQVLITNAYERNIQKQRCLIKRRHCEKSELEAKWGEHPNWVYVQTGFRSIYNDEDGLFYKVKDDDHPNLVSEETYLSRRGDTEVCFVGGIYMGEENIENNPIKHRDNMNTPKYNVVPFGYSRIGEHFFYYKSMMNALGWDNMLYDAMSEVVMNRALLEVDMPIVVSGSDKIDSDVVVPNAVVVFEDKDAKASPLLPPSNMGAGFNALRETEKSMSEGSVSDTISGQLPEASQKAYSVAQAQSNSKKLIGGVGKSIAESVTMYGDLMKDIALNHYTIPMIDELSGDSMKLKYRQFMVPTRSASGKSGNRRIKFDESLIGKEMSDDEKNDYEMKMLESSGYPDNKDSLIQINPELFARFKYLSRADAEEMFNKNQEYWQPVLLNLKQVLQNDPYVNQEEMTRRTLYSYFRSESDELMQKKPEAPPMDISGGGVDNSGGNPLGQMVKSKQMANVATEAAVQ